MKNSVSKGRLGIRGFTLIELLVVIVIIAILAAILFPVFSRARDRGRMASCQANLKQLALGLQQYLDDWDSCYPDQTTIPGITYAMNPASFPGGGSSITEFSNRRMDRQGKPYGMGRVLRPYIPSLDVFKCPSEQPALVARYHTGGDMERVREMSSYYIKYAMQYFCHKTLGPLKMSDIKYPTRAVFIYEQAWHSNEHMPILWSQAYWSSVPAASRPPSMRVNAVYFDCHVSTFAVPYLPGYVYYDGNWYFYRNDGTRISDAAGQSQGWDLRTGVHDKK